MKKNKITDTSYIASIAEDLIAYTLQKHDFLVAKPKFDRDGTDLIALIAVKDGAKFGRIQCKGRNLVNINQTNIKIPKKYVVGSFFLFLYLDIGDNNHLFIFFVDDIKKWKTTKNVKSEQYVLNIYKKHFTPQATTNPLSPFRFNKNKIKLMKKLIEKTTSAMEKRMWNIIKKQQKWGKLYKIKTKLDTLNSEIKYTEKYKQLVNENIKLLEEKKFITTCCT